MNTYEKLISGAYVIAEMSANHAGRLENALELVHTAKESGADCLKIQTYTADTITIESDRPCFKITGGLWDGYTLYDLYQHAYTPWEWHEAIKHECDTVGIDFLSTPFDPTAVDFLETLDIGFYKIASFELVDIPLIEYTARKHKPMILSCGMASVAEIQEAVDSCRRQGNEQIVLLKCSSAYPARYEEMNLRTITDMQERFRVPVGLSDHSMGSLAAVIAVSLGACVIEKHFCLSRSIKNPDSEFSMEPTEFREMVDSVRRTVLARGEVSYSLTEGENISRLHRRSLFVVENIAKGGMFTEKNVRSIRPADGMSPKLLPQVLGGRATRDLEKGTPLVPEHVSGMK